MAWNTVTLDVLGNLRDSWQTRLRDRSSLGPSLPLAKQSAMRWMAIWRRSLVWTRRRIQATSRPTTHRTNVAPWRRLLQSSLLFKNELVDSKAGLLVMKFMRCAWIVLWRQSRKSGAVAHRCRHVRHGTRFSRAPQLISDSEVFTIH